MHELSLTNELQQILDRFNAGDAAAKKQLVDRAYDRLLVVARKLLNSFDVVRTEEETASVLNEAYLRLGSALDEVRPKTVQLFFGLAGLQVRRVLLDAVRKLRGGRGGTPRPPTQSLDAARSGGEVAGGHDPCDAAFDTALEGLGTDVLEAIEKLPEDQRAVVDLHIINGLTQADTAEILGVHKDTVKQRWASARVNLAGLLKAYGLSK